MKTTKFLSGFVLSPLNLFSGHQKLCSVVTSYHRSSTKQKAIRYLKLKNTTFAQTPYGHSPGKHPRNPQARPLAEKVSATNRPLRDSSAPAPKTGVLQPQGLKQPEEGGRLVGGQGQRSLVGFKSASGAEPCKGP